MQAIIGFIGISRKWESKIKSSVIGEVFLKNIFCPSKVKVVALILKLVNINPWMGGIRRNSFFADYKKEEGICSVAIETIVVT